MDLQTVIPRSIRHSLKRFAWHQLDMSGKLPSGIKIQIQDWSDWTTYHEIFGCGGYDRPIIDAINETHEKLVVCDLGANVGFFTIRLAEILWERQHSFAGLEATMIEGLPTTFSVLMRRIPSELLPYTHMLNRLIGEKSGSAHISDTWESCIASVSAHGHEVPYIDLEQYYRDTPRIDLIKCDIEGSEGSFLHSSPNLFKKVRRVVMEVHHRKCDAAELRDILEWSGLDKRATLSESDLFSVYYFCRA